MPAVREIIIRGTGSRVEMNPSSPIHYPPARSFAYKRGMHNSTQYGDLLLQRKSETIFEKHFE